MSELSDYRRLVEAPAIRSYEATIASLRAENTRLQSEVEALRDVIEDANLYLEGEISGECQRKGILKSARSALTGAG